jgi:hypothetical protein
MAAVFPGGTVTEPTSEIGSLLTIKTSHIDQLYLEVVALENSILGSLGANRSFKPATSSGVPLTIRGVASQSADLLDIGSSASATDRLVLNAAGQLQLPVSTSTGGLLVNNVAIFSSASDSLTIRTNGTDGTSTFLITNKNNTSTALRVDTSFAPPRIGIGQVSSAPQAALDLNPGNSTTNSSYGIRMGNDVNLYRSATATLRTDSTELDIGTTGGTIKFITGGSTNPLITGSTAAQTVTYAGTDYITVASRFIEVATTAATTATGIILRRPDGARRLLTISNTDTIVISTTGF